MRMKNKGPKTKADIRFGWKRRGLLVCLFLSLVVLILEGVDNRHTAGYRFAMDMLYALAWAGLELESLLRLGREVREKGFGKSQPCSLTTGSAGGLDEPLRGIFRYRL